QFTVYGAAEFAACRKDREPHLASLVDLDLLVVTPAPKSHVEDEGDEVDAAFRPGDVDAEHATVRPVGVGKVPLAEEVVGDSYPGGDGDQLRAAHIERDLEIVRF